MGSGATIVDKQPEPPHIASNYIGMGTRLCLGCGASFEPKTHRSFYCSRGCRLSSPEYREATNAARRVGPRPENARNCAQCGASFIAYRSNGKFCSRTCYMVNHRSEYMPHKWYPSVGKAKKAEWTARRKEADPESIRESKRKVWLKRAYGLTIDDYNRMVVEQGGCCALCGELAVERKLDVDHCHKTGRVRALLCRSCNNTLGKVENKPGLIESIVAYLRQHSEAT